MRNASRRTIFIYTLIFCLAGTAAVFLRLYPLRYYASDEALDKAAIYVTQTAARTIRHNLKDTLPADLGAERQNHLVVQRLNSLLQKDRDQVQQTIRQVARQIDQRNPPQRRFPWLLASDSFYYYDLTHSLETTGRFSPIIKGSKYFHPKMNAPDGYWEPLTLHPFVGLALHRVIKHFMPDVTLMASVSWTPLILILIALMIFLITSAALKISPWPAAAAAILLACAEVVLKRSTLGWYDNDPYNIVFPMLLMLMLALALRARTRRTTIIGGIALACALCLYSLFWQGWVFAASVLAAALIACTADRYLCRKFQPETSPAPRFQPLWLFISFTGAGLVGISLIFGPGELIVLFREGWQALQGFFNSRLPVWPDNYITVGELKRSSAADFIHLTGGWPMTLGAVIGFLSSLIRLRTHPNAPDRSFRICIIVFALAAVLLSLGAQRFTLLAITPLAFLFLFGANDLLCLADSRIPQNSDFLMKCLRLLTPALLLTALTVSSLTHAEQRMPALINRIYNNTWDDAMQFLKTQTPSDAIIDTWWSPGHFIKAMGQRRVIFDGASISSRQSYWLAQALMAAGETQSLNLLRLLNNGATAAVDRLREQGLSDSESAQLLHSMIRLPQDKTLDLARQTLPPRVAREILQYTHGTPDPVYLLISNDMIRDLVIYPLIAGWNVSRIEELNSNPQLRAEIPPAAHKKDYINFLWSLSGGQPRISGILNAVEHDPSSGVIRFAQGLTCDIPRRICRIASNTYGHGIPAEIIVSDGQQIITQPQANATLSYSVVVGQRHGHYEALLAERTIAHSLLVRLYFFGDTGLDHIRRVHQTRDATQQLQIDLFKVSFE